MPKSVARLLLSLSLVGPGVVLMNSAARAVTTDDVKWITQCLKDNSDEGAKRIVVLKYCSCMNNKMTDDETLSITEWEKTHPDEQKACEGEAGWE